MNEMDKGFDQVVNIINQARENAFRKVNEELILMYQARIRHHLTDALREGAGHIGYSISKEFRGKGYGSEGLKLTIEIAKEIVPEEEIYLRVNKENAASQKVMIKNGAYRAGEDEGHCCLWIIQTRIYSTKSV